MREMPLALRLLIQHGFGYLRSTQVVPMVVAWTGIWAILAAFAFVNFQQEGLTVLTALGAIGERLSWLPTPGPLGTTQPDGSLTFDGGDVRKIVATYWGSLSAALYIVTLIVARVRGVHTPMALRTRLLLAVWLGGATFAAFAALYLFSEQPFHGSTATWVMVFIALSVLPVLVSLYSLTVTSVIDRTRDALLRAPPRPADSTRAVAE
jgi:hypothetical protein